jgi:hypothetical protein
MADGIRNVDGIRTPDNLKSVVRSKEDKEEKDFQEYLKNSGKEQQEDQDREQQTAEDKLILSDHEGSETQAEDGDLQDEESPTGDDQQQADGKVRADDDDNEDEDIKGIDVVV